MCAFEMWYGSKMMGVCVGMLRKQLCTIKRRSFATRESEVELSNFQQLDYIYFYSALIILNYADDELCYTTLVWN